MKVLVIGSEGQLGSEIKNISKTQKNISWIFSSIETLNLLNLNSINTYLSKTNPTVIINCAAYTNVDKAEMEFNIADLINHKAPNVISKWTSKNKRKLVHISTDYVFEGLSKIPLNENSFTNPVNEYGRSKLKGEQVCLKNDPTSVIIRTSWLYSSFGKNFVKTMIDLMKKNNSIRVVNDQIGSPTYANDLAKVILKIIINYKSEFGLFHYSNEGEISWFEFARSIREIYKLDCEIIGVSSNEFNTISKRPKYSLLDITKKLWSIIKLKAGSQFSTTFPCFARLLRSLV